jgi:hypothetical protein
MSSLQNKLIFFMVLIFTISISIAENHTIKESTSELMKKLQRQINIPIIQINIDISQTTGDLEIVSINLENGMILEGEDLEELMGTQDDDTNTEPPGP